VTDADARPSIRAAVAGRAPVLIFLAGPNGAGKSTFFHEYLAGLGLPFVNADIFAAMLRAADPGAAAGAVDRRAFDRAEQTRAGLLEARVSFCTETVFSDPERSKLQFLERARAAGYAVFLVFIGLESAELSVARVMHRVAAGGHDIPDEKLRSRFPRTLANLRAAIALVDEAFVFDNSSAREPYRLVAVYEGGQLVSTSSPVPSWMSGMPGI
jgi:predicted ABC-type ATPase